MKQIFIDLEWNTFGIQKTFLASWYKNQKQNGFLYGRALTSANIQKLFNDVDYIFVYGPDIGRIENEFGLSLKDNYKCINLMTAFKRLKPKLKNHQLVTIEKHYRISRKTLDVKLQRNNLHELWKKDPELVKKYCAEDSYNLKLVFDKLKAEKKMTRKEFLIYRLVPKKKKCKVIPLKRYK